MIEFLLIFFIAYLIGAVPTGYWFCRCFFAIDITKYGSGNIGASNVARVLGYHYFVLIFLCDACKAYGALWMLSSLGWPLWPHLYVGICALLLGNRFSPFLKFKGGRGVATTVGICLFVLPWQNAVGFMVAWLVFVGITRKPFIASLLSIIGISLVHIYIGDGTHYGLFAFLCVWFVIQHRSHVYAWYNNRTSLS